MLLHGQRRTPRCRVFSRWKVRTSLLDVLRRLDHALRVQEDLQARTATSPHPLTHVGARLVSQLMLREHVPLIVSVCRPNSGVDWTLALPVELAVATKRGCDPRRCGSQRPETSCSYSALAPRRILFHPSALHPLNKLRCLLFASLLPWPLTFAGSNPQCRHPTRVLGRKQGSTHDYL